MFELNQIQQLLAIEQYGNLSRAAEALHLSQPALTRSMQRLESELGTSLFNRGKNKIEFNDAGRIALAQARKVMEAANTMTNLIRLYAKSLSTITVGSCTPSGIWDLTPELTERFPEMTISSEMKPSPMLLEGLLSGQYTLIITDQPVAEPGVLSRHYMTETLFVSMPPAHPLADRASLTCSDLAGQTMLLYSELGIWRDFFNRKMQDVHFIIQTDRKAMSDLISASVFPSFATNRSVRHFAQAEHRVDIPIDDPEVSIRFYISTLEKNQQLLDVIPTIAD